MADLDVDDALALVGGFYPYHIAVFIILGLTVCTPLCYQSLTIVFIGYEPPHHCTVPWNQTINEYIPQVIQNGETTWDKCRIYRDPSLDNSTVECTNGWTYDSQGYSTMVTEWDLVCDKNYMVEMSQVIYQAFCMVGELCICYLVDRYGRKPVIVVASLLVALFGTCVAYSTNFVMLVVMRGITAICSTSILLSGGTLTMELFDSSKRTYAGVGLEGPWLMVLLPMALFAWAIPHWRDLQLFFSLLNILSVIHIWILPESVPWLVATGRYDKAEATLTTVARRNKVQLTAPITLDRGDDEHRDKLHPETDDCAVKNSHPANPAPDVDKKAKDVTIKDVLLLFTDRTLRKHTLISMFLWFVNNVIYYILTLVSPTLPGDRFMNFFYLSAVELPAYASTMVIVKRYGRRIPLCLFHLAAGILLIIMNFMPMKTASGVDLTPLSTTLMIMAKFAISASFAIIVFYTLELFPTTLRGTANGIVNIFGKFGSLSAPIAAYAVKTNVSWLPSVICSLASILVGLLTLLLPETNNKPLPQTVEDCLRLYDRPQSTRVKFHLVSSDVTDEKSVELTELKSKT